MKEVVILMFLNNIYVKDQFITSCYCLLEKIIDM